MSNFPGSLDNDASLYIAKDFISTALNAAMAIGDTTAVVRNPAGWVANMIASVESEQMLVTGVSGNLITLTRAFNGTTAVAHANGKTFSNNVDAAYQSSLKSAVIAVETALGANLSNVNPSPVLDASRYDFDPQTPGGSLIVGANTITLTPVPLGVNGTDAGHYLYISGGTGTAEGALIVGGTAVAGAPTGTVIVTCLYTHSGAWTIRSANGGIQEAINAIGPTTATYASLGTGGGSVYAPAATYIVYGGPILVPSNVEVFGTMGGTIIQTGTAGITLMQTVPRSLYARVHDLTFNLNSTNSSALTLMSSQLGRYWNLEFQGGSGVTGTDILLDVSGSADTTYNTILNDFNNIHIEIGTKTPIVLTGSNVGPAGVSTENTFRNLWVAGGGVGQPLIGIVQAADSNYWYNLNFESTLASAGIFINSQGTALAGAVGGQYIDYVVASGVNAAGTVVSVGVDQSNISVSHVVNLGWLTTYGVDPTNTSVVIQGYKWPADGYGIQATGGLILGDTDNGTALVMPRENVLLVNGANNNVAAGTGSYARIYGPTGAFSISGFPGGVDGRILHVLNSVSQIMTIKNLTGSSAGNQIITLTGADVVLRAGPSFATFIYSAVDSAWILASTN